MTRASRGMLCCSLVLAAGGCKAIFGEKCGAQPTTTHIRDFLVTSARGNVARFVLTQDLTRYWPPLCHTSEGPVRLQILGRGSVPFAFQYQITGSVVSANSGSPPWSTSGSVARLADGDVIDAGVVADSPNALEQLQLDVRISNLFALTASR